MGAKAINVEPKNGLKSWKKNLTANRGVDAAGKDTANAFGMAESMARSNAAGKLNPKGSLKALAVDDRSKYAK